MLFPFFIGAGWNYLSKGSNWKYVVGFGITTAAGATGRARIWSATKWAAPYVWQGGKWVARGVARGAVIVAADAAIMGKAAATTRIGGAVGGGAMIAAGAAVGYTGGAVIGTGLISLAEKEGVVYEGATADVLDFYLLRGGEDSPTSRERSKWYESDKPILNIPGDVKFITGHYWNKWTD